MGGWLGLLLLLGTLSRVAADKTNSPLLTVKRIFDSGEFGGDGFSARGLADSSGYTTFESSKAASGGRDLVRHDPKTGTKEILVPAADFVPPGQSSPLGIDDHTCSKDKSRLLLFTNSKRVSIASVPNMRYYDTINQERSMGLPADNADGYRNGSPITFASQLKGNLLLIHGTGDDNCHYQGAETLVNEFIRQNKQFRMMSYPNRSHAISEGANTTLHLRELMTSFLHEKLPAGAR